MPQKAAMPRPQGNYRWLIAVVLMLATTINYIDRSVLSFTMLDENFRKEILGIPLQQALTAADLDRFRTLMGYVDSAFKWAYGLGFIFVGWFIDRVGVRRGFSFSIALWSLAGVAIGWVSSVKGLVFARFALGFGEAGNYPSAIKSVAEWFPPQERALATGVFNSGANIGIILTAAAVPWLTVEYGWRSAFIVTGSLGLVLLAVWLWLYHRPADHPNLSPEEYDYIRSGDDAAPTDDAPKPSWFKLLGYRQTWAFITGKVLSDPVWWFYLTWLPDFFNNNDAFIQKLDLKTVGLPFLIIYLVSDLGNIVFGWVSSYFLRRGWSANAARKVTMLVCAVCVLPVFFASFTTDYRLAIALISLATAAHQGFSVNNFTIISDVFPQQAVASVVGIGGLFGSIASALFAAGTGLMIVKVGYVPLFAFASTSYLVALAIIHFLIPRLEKVRF